MAKTNKKTNRTQARFSRFIWYIHFIIFVIVQIIFFKYDGQIGQDWNIMGLNSIGEWVVFNNPLREWIQVYQSQPLNGISATWIIILLIHGLLPIVSTVKAKSNQPYINSPNE
jgi:hypothetical protein